MKTIEANITWNSAENGCLEAPFSGIQPSFLVAGELITSRIESADGYEIMERGQSYRVIIKLPYGEQYVAHLHPGMEVRLHVGERRIATGKVERIVN
jgi:hypothetical protein